MSYPAKAQAGKFGSVPQESSGHSIGGTSTRPITYTPSPTVIRSELPTSAGEAGLCQPKHRSTLASSWHLRQRDAGACCWKQRQRGKARARKWTGIRAAVGWTFSAPSPAVFWVMSQAHPRPPSGSENLLEAVLPRALSWALNFGVHNLYPLF